MTSWAATLRVTGADVERIVDRLYLSRGDRRRNLSAFWILLLLSGLIASAGVVATSTATVIGAMIVAPLMTPILGTALAIVLSDRRQLGRSVVLVLSAAAAVVLTGYVLGLLTQLEVTAVTNSEVAGRVSPRLIDLVAAVATGLVGAFALVRSDVSDTLPGVAIAISLVPPLAVVGLTLESGAGDEAAGALLLFSTNVAAIIATSTAVMLAVGVRQAARDIDIEVSALRGRTLVAVIASLIAVSSPLAAGSVSVAREQWVVAQARPLAEEWTESQGWELTDVFVRGRTLYIVALGLRPKADLDGLRADVSEAGLGDYEVEVTLVLGGSRTAVQEG